ncbi:MAG: hypothetical protein ACYS0G_02405 [Planctomycetota bacterium]|jgi:hypothetical protein
MARHLIVGLIVAVLALPAAVLGQESPDQYLTWVRYYTTNPGREVDFVKLINKISGETLNEMLADGSLISWGIAVPFTRRADSWTHLIWLSVADWSRMDRVVAAFDEASKGRSELENRAVMAEVEEVIDLGSVHDIVVRHVVVPSVGEATPPSGPPAYFRASYYKARPGQVENAVNLYQEIAVPLYEQLMAEGVILDCALAQQEIVTQSEWSHMSWYLVSDLAALDRVKQAAEQTNAARSQEERDALTERFHASLNPDAYWSEIIRIVHMGGQEQETP